MDRKLLETNVGKMAYAISKTANICNLVNPFSPAQEAEIFFRQLREDLLELREACRYIDNRLDEALNAQDNEALLSVIPFIESGKGKTAWKYVGETRRLLQILSAIRLEVRYHTEIFCTGCQSIAELEVKYLVMLFALRRLTFCLSEESVKEAEKFLKTANLSPFILHVVLQNEVLPSDMRVYRRLEDLLDGIWNEEERHLFLQMAEMAGEKSVHEQ